MKLITLILIGFINTAGPAEKWYEGSVVTSENEVITGEFSINHEYHSLILKNGEGISVLPSHKVNSFRFYDRDFNINRKYLALTSVNGKLPVRRFYEIVEEGAIHVLRLKKSTSSPYSFENDSYTGNNRISLSDEAYNYSYYLFFKMDLIPLERFGKQVRPLIEAEADHISLYIDKHKLNVNQPSAVIQLILYYNQFIRQRQATDLAISN
ncbi:hypothetical protein LVD17_14850 [Fulvivirga ulvae]|uniref:hypothetical protein n=1 Tax=Fulvivirga ulvae TaxID=2904245 RepID=UPI001F1D48FC|nr:hypothetical protein [Fulvivirga ulvae]UII29578.1 hypothetical protein LVD17_14850 [Fulvivirga ulvae]